MYKIIILIFFLIKSVLLTDNIYLEECSIDDSKKTDCAEDIANETPTLEQSCYNRGCCYKKIEGTNSIPWCYNKTIIPTTIITIIPTTEPEYDCDYKCQKCNPESLSLHLCLSCKSGYKKVNYTTYYPQYLDCVEENTILEKYYYNNITEEYRPCYQTCQTCEEDGDAAYHNCLTCVKGFRFRPDKNPEKNCVVNCTYFYLSPYGEYKCLEKLNCPEESNLIIVENNQCIDDCKKDENYTYQYNGVCYKSCPKGTTANSDKICIEDDTSKCTLGTNKAYFNSTDDLSGIKVYVKSYINEFNYTDNHVSLYSNEDYNILVYKNSECITELNLEMPSVDFKECYTKVQLAYNITQNLVIVIVDKLGENNPTTLYSFYHPISGEKLDAETICQGISITVSENLYSFLDESSPIYNQLISLLEQDINIFDLSDPFYTDICYDFESPTDKDIPLKDRVSVFYPNATLCDNRCTNTGINLDDMTSICDCSFVDITKSNIVKENVILDSVFGDVFDAISESNILVMKCYKYIFKHFTRSVGGWLCLIILIIQIGLTIFFYLYESIRLKRYVFNLTEDYLSYLTRNVKKDFININNDANAPPKKHVKIIHIVRNNKNRKNSIRKEGNIDVIRFNTQIKETKAKVKFNLDKSTLKKSNIFSIHNKNINISNKSNKELLASKNNLINPLTKENDKIEKEIKNIEKAIEVKINDEFFTEYLATPLDDMEYDDAIFKDKRTFGVFFAETLKARQMIAYTFIAVDPLKTRGTKIMLFGLNIILYFVVNGLFFSEDYISEVYNSTEEEEFFTFFPRSINRFIYCTFVSIVISYLTELFFFEEKKIASIFKREKEDKNILKEKITKLIKDISNRYLGFILTVFIIILFAFYYLLCFNYVYPKTQVEWVKSSIIIFLIMQILSFLSCLLESCFRILSFKCKSEKCYKISKLLSE